MLFAGWCRSPVAGLLTKACNKNGIQYTTILNLFTQLFFKLILLVKFLTLGQNSINQLGDV